MVFRAVTPADCLITCYTCTQMFASQFEYVIYVIRDLFPSMKVNCGSCGNRLAKECIILEDENG